MTNGSRDVVFPIGPGMALPEFASEPAIDISGLSVCVGFLFSARTIFVLVAARWFNAGTEPGVLAGFLVSSIVISAALFSAIGGSTHLLRPLRSRPLRWVMAYLMFSGFSLIWSASASSSVFYWASLAGDVAIVVLLFRAFPAESAARGLLCGFIAGSVLLSAIAWIMPAESDLRLGDLEYFNTNQIANLCALSILLIPLLARRRSALWRSATIFLALTLLRTLSKSTLIAFVAAQIYRLLRDSGMSRRGKWLSVIGAGVAIACFWTLLDAYYGVYTSAGNQAETLTGRTAIWAWSLDAALQHPLIGNGFDAMWKVAPPFGGELFEARHAENEILQQFFAYGVCGIVLLAGVYGSLFRCVRRSHENPTRTAVFAILIYVVVRGVAEAEPFDLLLPLWLVATLALLLHARLQVQQGDSASCISGGAQ